MKYLLAAGLAAGVCTVAQAQTTNSAFASRYSYLEAAYVPTQSYDANDGKTDGDGVHIDAAWRFVEPAYVYARGETVDLDNGSDVDTFSLGIGMRGLLADVQPDVVGAGDVDIYMEIGYERIDADFRDNIGSAEIEGDGIGIDIGLRWLVAPMIEANPYVGYVHYREPDISIDAGGVAASGRAQDDLDGIRAGLRGIVDVNDALAAVLGYEYKRLDIGDLDLNVDTFRVGMRWYFDQQGM